MRRFWTPLLVAVAFLAGIGTTTLAQTAGSTVTLSPGESVLVVVDEVATNTTQPITTTTRPPTTAPPATTPATTQPPTTVAPATTQPAATTPPAAAGTFRAAFNTAADLDLFNFEVRHGAPNDPALTPSWQGDHDMSCGSPSTLRTVNQEPSDVLPGPVANVGDLVWWCQPAGAAQSAAHIMTSMHSTGYAHLDFSPRQSFNDVKRVCWDQNFTQMGRKWTQVAIVPEALFQQNDGSLAYVKLGLQVEVGAVAERLTGDAWMLDNGAGGSEVQIGQQMVYQNFDTGGLLGSQDKGRRYQNCAVDLGNGTVRLELERSGGTVIRDTPGSFPDGDVRVIFQDVTYNASKGPPFEQTLTQNTWHWDNIVIETE